MRTFPYKVEYDATGFLEKNGDALSKDAEMAMHASQDSLLKILFPQQADAKRKVVTLVFQFQV